MNLRNREKIEKITYGGGADSGEGKGEDDDASGADSGEGMDDGNDNDDVRRL
jgi:hypothetical protein